MNPFDPYSDPNAYDPNADTAGGLPPLPSAAAPDWRAATAIPDLSRMVGMPSPYAAMLQQRPPQPEDDGDGEAAMNDNDWIAQIFSGGAMEVGPCKRCGKPRSPYIGGYVGDDGEDVLEFLCADCDDDLDVLLRCYGR
jgi:hypothetical protein